MSIFKQQWIGKAGREGDWIHPANMNKLDTQPHTLTTLLDGERPHFWASPEAWEHYAQLGLSQGYRGIPYLGRDLGEQNIHEILRHPWVVGTPSRPRRAVAVPFYAGGPNHDERWIREHKRLSAAHAMHVHGLTVYGVLRAVRTGRDKEWGGEPVPHYVLRHHCETLRYYNIRPAIWEGDEQHFDAAWAAVEALDESTEQTGERQ